MVTETPPDPTIEVWSDRLEEELVEAGMEQPQARAYRHAFELGLTRVISQTATRQEFQNGLADLERQIAEIQRELRQTATKQDLTDAIAGLRSEMRFLFLLLGGIMTGMLSALIALVA